MLFIVQFEDKAGVGELRQNAHPGGSVEASQRHLGRAGRLVAHVEPGRCGPGGANQYRDEYTTHVTLVSLKAKSLSTEGAGIG